MTFLEGERKNALVAYMSVGAGWENAVLPGCCCFFFTLLSHSHGNEIASVLTDSAGNHSSSCAISLQERFRLAIA